MNWVLLIVGILIGYGIFFIISSKIHIDFSSFFRKGFKKTDNTFGLYCYVGKQGKGKTYSAIKFLMNYKKNGYRIITNVKSFNVFSDTIYLDNIYDIIRFCKENIKDNKEDKYIIFFDEIFTILEKNTRLNKEILSFLSQLRKRSIILITTAQEWAEINITFRRYCRYQIDCNMFALPFFKTALIFNSINDGDQIKWDEQQQDFVAPRISANFSKCNKYVIDSYDTYETINVGL